MKRNTIVLAAATLGFVLALSGEAMALCKREGNWISIDSDLVAKVDYPYIKRAGDYKLIGGIDGQYVKNLITQKIVCQQDGDYVKDFSTRESLGKGDLATVCVCSGRLPY